MVKWSLVGPTKSPKGGHFITQPSLFEVYNKSGVVEM